MNLRRMFANAIVRRVAFVVVGVLFAFVASCFSNAEAAVCGIPTASEAAIAAGASEVYAYENEGRAACQAVAREVVNTVSGTTRIYSFVGCEVASGVQRRWAARWERTGEQISTSTCARGNISSGSDAVQVGWFWSTPGCPPGEPWNEALQVCGDDCEFDAPPLGSGHVQCSGAEWGDCPRTVCSDGCGYDDPGGGLDGYVIDGTRWAVTTGWMPRGQACTVGMPSLGTPPSDSDGDGTSDGNDGSPNNPGSDGSGNNQDESKACGGPGQPDCEEDGSNAGSGKGNSSGGGGDCSSPPVSSGDAILAQIAFQTWATRCAIAGNANEGSEGGSGVIPGTGDGAKEGTLAGIKDWLDGKGEGVPDADDPWMDGLPGEPSDWNMGLGGGSCPAPVSASIELGGISAPIEFSFQPMCDLAGLLNTLFKALGALIAAYIIAGVRR